MIKYKKNYLVMILAVVVLGYRTTDSQNTAVIKVNKVSISYDEFLRRLNELPIPNEDHETLGIIRQQLVCSLIGEAILSQEAEIEKLNKLSRVKAMAEEYNHEALYEQWMKSEVSNKIKITPGEIQKGYDRLKNDMDVEYWTVSGLKTAEDLRLKLLKGEKIDVDPEYKVLHYGEAEQNIEDSVYSLTTGQVTSPIKVDSLYYIFQLKGIIKDPEYVKHDVSYYRAEIIKRIRAKKEVHLAAYKLASLMKNSSFIIEEDLYRYLLSQLEPIIFNSKLTEVDKASIIQQELYSKSLEPGNMNNVPLVIFKNGKVWTVKEVWEKLAISPYPINYNTPDELKYGLQGIIKQIVLLENIARDAVKKHLDKANYVQFETQMWGRNLLAETLLDKTSGSFDITNKDIIEAYEKHKSDFMNPEKRKVLQLVVRTKEFAEELYKKITDGGDFLTLAKKYSMNQIYLNKKDPGIFITPGYFGDAGKAAFAIKPGEITKPEKVDDSSYAVLKLLEVDGAAPKTVDQVHDELYAMCRDKMTKEYVNNYLTKVIKKYRIDIDWKIINEIPYTGGDMAVRKTHFPLRNAVPYFPFFDYKAKWFREALSMK